MKNLAQDDLQAIYDVMGGLLDKQAAVLASKEDLKDLESRMATKDDLKDLEASLNQRMDEGFEALMEGIGSAAEKLADKEKFEKLMEWAREVGEEVGVKPRI